MTQELKQPPIVEAILDFDCDLPTNFKLAELEEEAKAVLAKEYPVQQKKFGHHHTIKMQQDKPPLVSAVQGLEAILHKSQDGKQLIQVRNQGYSFNRLAPYTILDDYLPEIKRTWNLYRDIANPSLIRRIQLRFINRILLPLTDGSVDLDDYFVVGPKLPDEDNLTFTGFVNQHSAYEQSTGNRAKITTASQDVENRHLPVLFDIETSNTSTIAPEEWGQILGHVTSLRSLSNRIFEHTLTPPCMQLFNIPD